MKRVTIPNIHEDSEQQGCLYIISGNLTLYNHHLKKKKRFSVSCLLPYDLGSLCKRNENMSVERLLLKGTQQPKCPRAEVCVNRLNIHISCNHMGEYDCVAVEGTHSQHMDEPRKQAE